MSADSVFTIHEYPIIVKSLDSPIYLLPFGDIHRYAHLCDTESWLDFCTWAKTKKNSYFLGMGDYDDMCSGSERKALTCADLHDTTRQSIDDIYQDRVNKLTKEISFMKDKLIGLIEGNHYGVFQSGMTTTQEMCRQLNTKFLGSCAIIRLSFRYGNKRYALDIFAAHGKGASRLLGGSLNAVQQMADIAQADIYLMGHDHQKIDGFRNRLLLQDGFGSLRLMSRKILFARTGSFLKGYVPEKPSYVAKALLPPTDIGVIKIELTPKRPRKENEDRFYVDIHASV
jgi:hypothetical protein